MMEVEDHWRVAQESVAHVMKGIGIHGNKSNACACTKAVMQ